MEMVIFGFRAISPILTDAGLKSKVRRTKLLLCTLRPFCTGGEYYDTVYAATNYTLRSDTVWSVCVGLIPAVKSSVITVAWT
jgi:hypothetical protein